ncbi:hypothetical protein Tco_1561033 [Tanacetum coccineum]
MTSQFDAWNEEVLCKNVSLMDVGTGVEEQTIFYYGDQDHMKKRPLFKMAQLGVGVEEQTILIMEAQDHMKKRPLFKMAQLGPSVEENTIWFMEAQGRMKKRPLFKWRNLGSETPFQAHDQPIQSLERGTILPMTSRFKSWNGEVLCKNVSLIDAGQSVEENTILFMEGQDRPSVEEQTILFMEAQDRMKQKPLLEMAKLGASVEEQTILIMEAQDHMKQRPLFKMA